MHRRQKSTPSPSNTINGVGLANIAYFLFLLGMVIGPTIGYITQIHVIKLRGSSEGFAPLVSLILLISNSLRIYFWFGVHFDIALLFQAIFMIIVQIVLVVTVLKVSLAHRIVAHSSSRSNNHNYSYPRDENDKAIDEMVVTPQLSVSEKSYGRSSIQSDESSSGELTKKKTIKSVGASTRNPTTRSLHSGTTTPVNYHTTAHPFRTVTNAFQFDLSPDTLLLITPRRFLIYSLMYICITGVLVVLTTALFGHKIYTIIGYAALAIEACLLLPQIHLNYTRKSCEGLTCILILTWVVGDIIKMIFFIVTSQPKQFIICGCFQLCCDTLLICQRIVYRNNIESYSD